MTSRIPIVTWLLFIVLGFGVAGERAAAEDQFSPRLTVFISDLHLGVGRDPKNLTMWHPMEDFRWQDEFSKFLSFLKEKGNGNTDLILNGDTFELWQSLEKDCIYKNADLGCSESEALKRIQHVIRQHQPELTELAAFAKSVNNHIYIIPGNHDAALLFRNVWDEVARAISVPGKVHLQVNGNWRMPQDGPVYAEHGHQIGKDVNSWKELWPKPFIVANGKTHLKRPWGEKFVQDYYNQFEHKYPIIDNVSEEGVGIEYARAAEGKVATVKHAAEFFNFVFFKVSWNQFADSLGDKGQEGQPQWNLTAIRARGPEFLSESVPKDHPFFREAQSVVKQKEIRAYFQSLSDDELRTICVKRAQQSVGEDCPKIVGSLGAAGEAIGKRLFGDTVLAEHLDNICRNKLRGCVEKPFQTFIYSHTHLAVGSLVPIKDELWRPVVFNTGAWQRTVTPEQLKVLAGGLKDEEVFQYIQPEDLPKCYSLVIVGALKDHEDQKVEPRLRYWTMQDGQWSLQSACTDSDLSEVAKEIKKRRDIALGKQIN
jgi:UDP-2,3-diacylglucosamine pyrophosphatase LpxH